MSVTSFKCRANVVFKASLRFVSAHVILLFLNYLADYQLLYMYILICHQTLPEAKMAVVVCVELMKQSFNSSALVHGFCP